MAKVWMPQDPSTIQSWIDTIENEASDRLSEWEMNFIDSIKQQFHRYGKLSEKQEKVLERIYAEYTS